MQYSETKESPWQSPNWYSSPHTDRIRKKSDGVIEGWNFL